MPKIPEKIEAWQMVEPGKLARASLPVPELKTGEALVEIAGCGVCHTDLSYFAHGVKTIVPPPITLGHEISGVVIAGNSKLVGKEVIVPAVMPCNNCPICAAGRENRCLDQKMPGNSLGNMGGFASHIVVPAQDLCVVENRGTMPLPFLSAVADAITTPYQAALKGQVQPGDLTVVIGTTGGVGVYMTQVLAAMGAKAVVGIGRNPEKLERSKQLGATNVISSKGKSAKDVRAEFKDLCKANNWPSNYGWKIFECTGTGEGQEMGLELLSFIGKLVVVGFGTSVNQYAMSRLMAFDAEIIGTWGCPPKLYPVVLDMVLSGKIAVEPLVDVRPMSQIHEAFQMADEGKTMKRIVLTPDF